MSSMCDQTDAALPTGAFGSWTVTKFRDSLISTLKDDATLGRANLSFYFYAVTLRGWSEISDSVLAWLEFDDCRAANAYVGTDHAITDPDGLEAMARDGVAVRLMQNYRGVFHPKVVWLERSRETRVWAGSNNITRDGLVNNIEFALAIRSEVAPDDLFRWSKEVHTASVELTDERLQSYRGQRADFEERACRRTLRHSRGASGVIRRLTVIRPFGPATSFWRSCLVKPASEASRFRFRLKPPVSSSVSMIPE